MVKDRMKQTGRRWTVSGARAMLHPGATHLNDQWEVFVEDRIEREQTRPHGKNAAWRAASHTLIPDIGSGK